MNSEDPMWGDSGPRVERERERVGIIIYERTYRSFNIKDLK